MTTHKRWLWWLIGVTVSVVGILFLLLPRGENSAPLPVKWTLQPNSIPLGTVLQGATVEMSLGGFSDLRPTAPPAWFSRLPQPIVRWVRDALDHHRARAVKRTWQIKVESPDFLRVDAAELSYDSTLGPSPTVGLHLACDRPGSHEGALTIRLVGHGYGSNAMLVPIQAKVLAKASRWSVLVTETPFERTSTSNGRDFEALSAITTRLAEQGVRVDFHHHLPKSLEAWNVILLGGMALVRLDAENMDRLQQFVIRGGHLIVSADAFFSGTVSKANDLLNRYGLRIENQDAGGSLGASQIAADPLTAGVTELSFWRPVRVRVTGSEQGKLLATMKNDEEMGFIALSRAPGRGEVILLAQSLWWNWVKPGQGDNQNARMLENLLAP